MGRFDSAHYYSIYTRFAGKSKEKSVSRVAIHKYYLYIKKDIPKVWKILKRIFFSFNILPPSLDINKLYRNSIGKTEKHTFLLYFDVYIFM